MSSKKNALFSVYDKTGVVEDAQRLVIMGWRIYASSGTAKILREAKIPVVDIAELVGGKPILGHRVVTMSRELAAALSADKAKPDDLAELARLNIPVIDFIRCDFYPLRDAIVAPGASVDSVVEKTDVGGPSMVHAAAKGLRIVVCRKEDMEPVLRELEETDNVSHENRQKLRARAEFEVAKYVADSAMFHGGDKFRIISGELMEAPLYGENPWQKPAGVYSTGTKDPLAIERFNRIEGIKASYNNNEDLQRALNTLVHMVAGYEKNFGDHPWAGVGLKHGNACGAAVGFNMVDTVERVARGCRRDIFGGCLMFNFPIGEEAAATLVREAAAEGQTKQMFDCVIAQSFSPGAVDILKRGSGRCRLLENVNLGVESNHLDTAQRFRYLRGGFQMQPNYTYVLDLNDLELKQFGPPIADRFYCRMNMTLAWAVGSTSNSNTITIVNTGMLIGNGVGQKARVAAAELAVKCAIDAGHKSMLKDAVAYSDSFFPFPDAVEVLYNAGIKTVFSTSGSIRDQEVQQFCADRGITLCQLPDKKARGFLH